MNLFDKTLAGQNDTGVPPIWFMRQAGRYHSHYQQLRKDYSFVELCQNPDVSAEAAMGPIRDFDFDAAILFSDILFPIEALGIPLSFAPGPQFGRLLREPEDLKHYHQPEDAQSFFWFQRVALDKLREQLPNSKGLIGFVGGLATLYAFAVEGSTKGDLSSAMKGLDDGRFEGLMDMLLPVLVDNMSVQAEANISCIAILDSGLGHFPYDWVVKSYLNVLRELLTRFKYRFPETKILYYSLGVRADYFEHLIDLPIDALGIDHHKELPELFERYGERFILQGNIPPEWISLPVEEYAGKLRGFLNLMEVLPEHYRNRWICGLGHGILPTAKEENVYMSIKTVRERIGGK